MIALFVIIRTLTFVAGTSLLGRMVRDRIKLSKTHFRTIESKIRWIFMALLVLSITASAFISAILSTPITVTSYVMFAYFGTLVFGHIFLDALRPEEEALLLARVEEAQAWIEEKLDNNP